MMGAVVLDEDSFKEEKLKCSKSNELTSFDDMLKERFEDATLSLATAKLMMCFYANVAYIWIPWYISSSANRPRLWRPPSTMTDRGGPAQFSQTRRKASARAFDDGAPPLPATISAVSVPMSTMESTVKRLP